MTQTIENGENGKANAAPLHRRCYAFEVWPEGQRDWAKTINARSAGKAKSEYHADVNECCDVPFTKIRCRKIGVPQTSDDFLRLCKYRGVQVRCGDRVKVGDGLGVIVGHNSSANFNVLFDDDSPEYAGLTLNVHPQSVELVA